MFKDSSLASVPERSDALTASQSVDRTGGDRARAAIDPRRLSEAENRPLKSSSQPLEDVQGRGDTRGIVLERAGVTDVRYPATAIDPDGIERSTIVNLEMSVAVPAESKGTHMSRFIEIVQADERALSPDSVVAMLRTMQSRLEATEARLAIQFPLFMEREAPVTKSKGMIDVDCGFVGTIDGDTVDLVQKVVVTVTSLCPCSKEISDYGA
ncbi:MAG: GTP cyclohydrolase, FolE2/MptA family, partial [Planctomycetota bacterium]